MPIRFALATLGLCLVPAWPGSLAPLLVTKSDQPGRLRMELSLPPATWRRQADGWAVGCAGCRLETRPGAPDLPVLAFLVAADADAAVSVRVEARRKDSRVLAEGLAPVRRPGPGPARPDPALYREAAAPAPRLGPPRRYPPLRSVEIPLAAWDAGARRLEVYRQVTVTVEITRASPGPGAALPARLAALAENPAGARVSAGAPAAKRASARGVDTGLRRIRIRVGDPDPSSDAADGAYALSFADLKRWADSAGLPKGELDGLRVGALRLFTGGQDTAPEAVDSQPRPPDLREIPMEVVDADGDGTFDGQDLVRFYGHGSAIWKRRPGADSLPVRLAFSADPYSVYHYYYLSYTAAPGAPALRLGASPAPDRGGPALGAALAYRRHGPSRPRLAGCDHGNYDAETGKVWGWALSFYGNAGTCAYRNDDLTLRLGVRDSLDGYTGGPAWLGFDAWPRPPADAFTPYPRSGAAAAAGGDGNTSYYGWSGSAPLELDSVAWKASGRGSEALFTGLTVAWPRRLRYGGAAFWVAADRGDAPRAYSLDAPAGARVWKIRDGVAEGELPVQGGAFRDSAGAGAVRYQVFTDADVRRLPRAALAWETDPAAGGAVADPVAGPPQAPEYLIVVPTAFEREALALRDYRRSPDRARPYATEVVRAEDLYRNWSSGKLSPVAIRDGLRWARSHWAGGQRLGYVLLLGAGHYDYRSLRPGAKDAPGAGEFLPVYEDRGASTDDFFASPDGGDPALALGRLPARSPADVTAYLDKVKEYEAPGTGGEWRSRLLLAADDFQQGGYLDQLGRYHTEASEALSVRMALAAPGLDQGKLYLLDYPANSAHHKPEATRDLVDAINRGVWAVNYFGHGDAEGWADEVLLQAVDVSTRLANRGRYPWVTSFACTVGRFDRPDARGLSEALVGQPGAGAIAAISATRETSYEGPGSGNANFALQVYGALMADSAAPVTLGDALLGAKLLAYRGGDRDNDRLYALLGEPVLAPRRPKLALSLSGVPDTLKGMLCGRIEGQLAGGGPGRIGVRIRAAHVPARYYYPGDSANPIQAWKPGSALFSGEAGYAGGRFDLPYLIPRQIPYGDTDVTLTAFAWDSSGREAMVSRAGLRVAGQAQNCPEDDGAGPRLSLFACDPAAQSEELPATVDLSVPACLELRAADSGGVAGGDGPDQGTQVELTDGFAPMHPEPWEEFLRRKSYRLSLDRRLRPGLHLLKASARDAYDHPGERTWTLRVADDSLPRALAVYNEPNPVKRAGTRFHLAALEPVGDRQWGAARALRWEIRIHDQAGRLVRRLERSGSGEIAWDGRDAWGNLLANGVYFYRARLTLAETGDAGDRERDLEAKRNVLVISR